MKKWMMMFLLMLAVPVLILVAGMKVEAETSGDWEYEVVNEYDTTYSEDTVKITGYYGSNDVLDIPDSLDGYIVSSIDIESWAFPDRDNVIKVVIPASITGEITAGTFGRAVQTIEVDLDNPVYCSEDGILYDKRKEILVCCPAGNKIENMEIPSTVKTISQYAFYYCSNIKTIEIPESVKTIGAYYEYTYVDEEGYYLVFDGTNDYEWRVFEELNNLSTINVKTGNTVWSSIDGILYNKDVTNVIFCPEAKNGEISIPNTVTEIGSYAFSGCSNLMSIEIPSTVAEIGSSAFSGCSNLESVTIPDGVTKIDGAVFSRCTNLVSVELPETITEISMEAFAHCSKLNNINLPKSLERILEGAFKDCVSLKSITIPANVRQIEGTRSVGGSPFSGCVNLETINVDNSNTVYLSKDGIVYDEMGTVLYLCPEGKSGTVNVPDGVTQIPGFYECGKLTEIILPTSITQIDEYAFYNCKSLNTITIPSSVKSIGVLSFCGCTSLLEVSVPDSVKEIGINAFGYWDEEITWGVVDRHKMEDFTLSGFAGSAAEQYAKENDIPFTIITELPEEGDKPSTEPEETPGTGDNPIQSALPTEDFPSANKGASSVGTPSVVIKTARMSLSGFSNKIAAGKKVQLTVSFTPSNVSNKNVIWTSSNPKIATVNQNGVVAFKKKSAGKSVIITATATDGSGAKAVFKLKSMKGVVKKVSISGAKKRMIKAGKALKLKAKVAATKGANKKLQWTSSNTEYAIVSASGKVKTKKAGKGKTVKITAMATDGSGKKQVVKIKIK